MHEFSLDYLRCIRCKSKLELEILSENKEIIEGFVFCKKCNLKFPIISKIPILWDDFSAYLSRRVILGGKLFHKANSPKMKKFVKMSLSKIKKNVEDQTFIEKKWTNIYQNSRGSKFYTRIKKMLKTVPKSELILEHGCSIGTISEFLAKKHDLVFGIDSSYSSIEIAKKTRKKNLDYFVSDSIFHPFGNKKFGFVLALNMLEIVEPSKLLKVISTQTNNLIFLSDPYDYDRGSKSVRYPIHEKDLRKKIKHLGYKISENTKKPSNIPWRLILNKRSELNYKVDVILGKKL